MTLFNTMGKDYHPANHRVWPMWRASRSSGSEHAGGRVRLELVSVWERRRSHRNVQTFSKRLDGPGKRAKSDWRICGRRIVLSLSAQEEADLEALLPEVSAAQRQLTWYCLHRLILERGLELCPTPCHFRARSMFPVFHGIGIIPRPRSSINRCSNTHVKLVSAPRYFRQQRLRSASFLSRQR